MLDNWRTMIGFFSGAMVPALTIFTLTTQLVQGQDAASANVSAASWSATASLATRYISRGLDLTNGPVAPEVSGEYRFPSGWYVNAVATKIDYFDMNAEVDGNTGMRGSLGAVHYDLGLYYYYYPGRAGANLHASFAEFGTRLSWGSGAVIPVFELFLSNDYFFGAGRSVFFNAGADVSLPGTITASARYGYTHVADNFAFSYPNYANWMLYATRSFDRWDVSAQLTDTSIDHNHCLDENRCSLKMTLRVTRNFGGAP